MPSSAGIMANEYARSRSRGVSDLRKEFQNVLSEVQTSAVSPAPSPSTRYPSHAPAYAPAHASAHRHHYSAAPVAHSSAYVAESGVTAPAPPPPPPPTTTTTQPPKRIANKYVVAAIALGVVLLSIGGFVFYKKWKAKRGAPKTNRAVPVLPPPPSPPPRAPAVSAASVTAPTAVTAVTTAPTAPAVPAAGPTAGPTTAGPVTGPPTSPRRPVVPGDLSASVISLPEEDPDDSGFTRLHNNADDDDSDHVDLEQ